MGNAPRHKADGFHLPYSLELGGDLHLLPLHLFFRRDILDHGEEVAAVVDGHHGAGEAAVELGSVFFPEFELHPSAVGVRPDLPCEGFAVNEVVVDILQVPAEKFRLWRPGDDRGLVVHGNELPRRVPQDNAHRHVVEQGPVQPFAVPQGLFGLFEVSGSLEDHPVQPSVKGREHKDSGQDKYAGGCRGDALDPGVIRGGVGIVEKAGEGVIGR